MGFRVGQGLIERYENVHILQNELVTSVEHVFLLFFFNWNCVQTYSRLSKLQGRTGHNEVHLQRLLDKGVQEAGGQPQNEPSGKRTRQLRNLLFNNGIKDPDSLHPPPALICKQKIPLFFCCHRVPMSFKTTSFVYWPSSPVESSTWIRLLRLVCNLCYTLPSTDPTKSSKVSALVCKN